MDFKVLFVFLFGTCLYSWAVPLSSSTNQGDLDSQLADDGKSNDNFDSEERKKRGVEALQTEDQQFEKRDTDEGDYDNEDDSDDNFYGRDRRGSENLDDSDYDQDEDETVERARRNSEKADKVQDDEYSNDEKRSLGDDAEERYDDQDDLNGIEKRDIYGDLDEEDDDEDDEEEEDEDFVKKRKKRSAETTTAIPSVSTKKDVKSSKNGTCKSQRSVTLSDLDKLLSVADDDDEEDNTEETESRNKRNMEEFLDDDDDDDYDNDGDEKAEILSRNRRDLDDDDAEDDDDDYSEDMARQARDLRDEDDDDEDEEEADEDDRKRRETDVDDEDDDDNEDDSDFNYLVRMLRDTTGDEEKQDDEEDDDDDLDEKIQSVATRDLSTSDVNREATENQPNIYEASNDNPAQNVDKREADYDYDEEDLDDNIEQQLAKRDEELNPGLVTDGDSVDQGMACQPPGSNQPMNIASEGNEEFSEKDIDKTRANPYFTKVVIDEPDDFSISEQGNNPTVTINNPEMKPRNHRPSREYNKLNLTKVNKHNVLESDKTSYRKKPSYISRINKKKPVYYDNQIHISNLKQQKRRSKNLHSNIDHNDNSIMSEDEKTRRESSNGNIPDNAGEPRGPIAKENKLKKVFAGMFVENPKADIQWVEPDMLANCWVHAMLAHSFGNGFSPSCNKDGTYSAKQCFLQRCWCVNKDGSPQDPYFDTRFFYAVKGAMHSCIQVI